ncbi:uncharacterized protein LOC133843623 [Drosophila sulfurigaster albostrigata]|uniref:uncharacterized protein LOC133843623 n=1 Tax=Drosophila sulfurigaster albostrigata TaxID=89887 RepID=UPI002D21D1BA|nr:uncharacterized protein LOC133843623 [Drosophila sulfurigaster albostrigata]XP_062133239.1 uncharacterized protein LOC133843623 [Drosophila sulfurigaster albostrigata]
MNLGVSMPISMQMQGPMSMPSSPSPSIQGMRMSYAAAVQTGAGVKVMISPRLNKANASSKSVAQQPNKGSKTNNKITVDTKFRIFDEQPTKPHIVRVDTKLYRSDGDQRIRMKNYSSKTKKPNNKSPLKATSSTANTARNDVDIKALKLQLKRLACSNAAGSATVVFKGNSLCDKQAQRSIANNANNNESPAFADSVSYFSFHQQRLQRIIDKQDVCAICLQSPEAMRVPQFEDKHFKNLEEAALLAQNRTMLRLWMNSDLLIS